MNRPLVEVILTMRRPYLPRDLLEALASQVAAPPFFVTLITTSPPGFIHENLAGCASTLHLRIIQHPEADRLAALRHAATGIEPPLALFLEEEAHADPFLLVEHFRLHARHLEPHTAILGPVGIAPSAIRVPAKDNDLITDAAAVGTGIFSCKRALPADAGFLTAKRDEAPESMDWPSALIRAGLVLYRFAYSPLEQPPLKETHPLQNLVGDMLRLGLEPDSWLFLR
ncbi:MAG: hypothetical protein PHP44_00490 [Kiritimatiellae bacterium]|nr:hypothetical protein [Kiritimatiellia bacterium]MDD4734561.1 hypothetical protein [Kiritimatiellia bacterium]